MSENTNKKQRLTSHRRRSEDLRRIYRALPIGINQDLFDGIRVTWPEVEAWALAVAGIEAGSWRFNWYVENWNVAEKVKAAKISGNWPLVLKNP